MVQFFVTLAETVRFEDEACWALTLPSAAIDTTAKPARTIKIRRIPTSNCTRFWVSSETPSNRAGCGAEAASAQRVYPHELGFGDDTQVTLPAFAIKTRPLSSRARMARGR